MAEMVRISLWATKVNGFLFRVSRDIELKWPLAHKLLVVEIYT